MNSAPSPLPGKDPFPHLIVRALPDGRTIIADLEKDVPRIIARGAAPRRARPQKPEVRS